MIGQIKLQKELFSYTLGQAPKSVLFLGDYGCGKHTLAQEYAKHLALDLIDITDNISYELLESIKFNSLLAMYLIDLDKLTEQAQNVVLKFVEEPVDTAYIILLASNEDTVIPTILNRCYKCKFEPYSRDEIVTIVGSEASDEILSVCTTPGQVRLVRPYFTDLKSLCNTIVTKLYKAPLYNALSISSKINYKDEYNKYDLNIFLKVLLQEYLADFKSGNSKSLVLYNIVAEESKKLMYFKLNKEVFMLHLLVVLWKEVTK